MNYPEIKKPVTVDANMQLVIIDPSHSKGRPQPQILFTATKDQLTCYECYLYLWRHVVSLKHLSSEGLINAIEEFFRDLDILGIEIREPNGALWTVPPTWEVFQYDQKDDDDDSDEDQNSGRRWVTSYKEADETGIRPSCMRCRAHVLPRLICLELFVHATVAKYARGPVTERCSFTHYPLGW